MLQIKNRHHLKTQKMKKTLYLFMLSLFLQANLFAQAPNISYTNTVQTYTVGYEVTPLNPTNLGGAITYGQTTTPINIGSRHGVAVDAVGNVYYPKFNSNTIIKRTPAGLFSDLAGSDTSGSTDGMGLAASFNTPFGVAVDASGNVYVADTFNHKIRKITSVGMVSTLAGSGVIGSSDGTGTAASFYNPFGVAVDASGNVYVADMYNNKIRKITPAGVVSTLAGSGSIGSTNGSGSAASFYKPQGVAVDASGNVYVADWGTIKIRKITPTGLVSTLAGSGSYGSVDGSGTTATFDKPESVAVDPSGNVYVADGNNNKIRKITPAGVVSTLAGSGSMSSVDGMGTAASFGQPNGVTIDVSGNLYVTENDRIRKINTTGGYSISPVLPTGLYIDGSTGAIRGIPSVVTTQSDYTVTATNSYGSSSFKIVISTGYFKPTISYNTPQNYTVGKVITPLSPAANTAAIYSISPNLPTGLSINASTGVISGMPTTVTQLTAYTITATNVAGSDSFNIVINTVGVKPTISYTTPQPYIINAPITALTPSTIGSPVTSYAISPSPSTGLSFNSSTGTISGTPIVAIGEKTYTITANNSYGTDTTTVVISTVTAKPALSYTTPNSLGIGSNIVLAPITNTGLPATNYSILPQLNNGLNFNTSTGIISGTPNVVSPAIGYTITAINSYGNTSVNIVISTAYYKPTITYTTPQNYSLNTTITPLTPTNTGSPVDSYSISPSLPSGLTLNTTTGEITGTPILTKPATNHTVTATNSYGSATFVISITVTGVKPSISYTLPSIFTVGTAITPLMPTNNGSPIVSYNVSPNLPTGLSFNISTGVISGIPTVTLAQTNYTITATNSYGSGNFVISIAVAGAKPTIGYTTPQTYTVGTAITPLQPTNTGGTVTSYTVTPSLPMGLILNTTTGIISGTPTVTSSLTSYIVSATNAYGTGTATILITINTAGTKPTISYTTPQTYTVGAAITPLQPTNTGSLASSYNISPMLPSGLIINVSTGIISGTTTVSSAQNTYTVSATNAYGEGTTTIRIAVDRILPSNNFTITSKGESCLGEKNGEISIAATAYFTYVATINGMKYNFVNNSLKVSSLVPATYNVSVTIPGETFEQSFTVIIAKGATITGKSSVISNKIAVEIAEGTAPYTVFVNGVEQFETTESNFSVETKKGGLLEVKTAKACEGIYAKDILGLEGAVSAYPNPTSGSFEIELPTLRKKAVIALYAFDGHLISTKTYTIENGKVQLTLENQPTGTYIAKIELDTPNYLKIIKN
jgi:sugar lactone lactonase YvrE